MMKTEERMALLKAVLSIAKADSVVEVVEMSYFQQMCYFLGCDNMEIANAQKEVLGGKEAFEDYLKEIKGREAQLLLLYGMTGIAFADGDYAEEEREKVKRAAEALGIEEKKLEEIEELIKEDAALRKKTETVLEKKRMY